MSVDDQPLNVVILWNMHQPQYTVRCGGEYRLPWAYLHAIKDYTDMAAHLEAEPRAKAVVNFTPTLLEQIADYAKQLRVFFETGVAFRDSLLNVLSAQ